MYGYPELTKQDIREKLSTNQKWIEKALILLYSYQTLILLYSYQTESEQEEGVTVEQNGQGFNLTDVYTLSHYAEQVIAGKTLSDIQFQTAKELLPKYAGQVLRYIQSNPNHLFKD